MRYDGFEREHINNIGVPSLEDLERYMRFSEVDPIIKCIKTADSQTMYKYEEHPSRFVRQEIAKGATDSGILNKLKNDKNYFVRAEALRNPNCPIDFSDIQVNWNGELVLSAMASHKGLNKDLKDSLLQRAIALNSFSIRYCLIRFQEYNGKFVERCKEDFDHYGLTMSEVLNETCPLFRVLEIIKQPCETEILIEIAKRFSSIEVQLSLAKLDNIDVNLAMIENKTGLCDEVVQILAQSKDFEVRSKLAENKLYREAVLKYVDQLEY